MKHLSLLCLALFFMSACSTSQTKSTKASVPQHAEVSLVRGDSRVGTYTSSWKGFRTSSYWIEGPEGLIIIDTQFLTSAAEEMLDWAEKTTGKKAVLAVVLHPNPDKFNGTAVFQKRGIKVITSAQVLQFIPQVHELRKKWFYDRFKPDYPAEMPKLESFGDKTTTINAAGLSIKLHVLGKGCSDAHVAVEFDKNLFVGDLVTIGFHSWLELGHLKDWIGVLEELAELEPDYVRTGRGGNGDMDSIIRQKKYLKDVVQVFESFKPKKGQKLSERTGERIQEKIFSLYPTLEYRGFVEKGLQATWTNLGK
jgi:glyoxylase-like metal-dependent hydrolase (beta-lactamase superfamily II)